MVRKENSRKTVEGFKSKGHQHSVIKKIDAKNRTDTTPQTFNSPDMAQAARGNGPVSLPGEQPMSLGRSADAGVKTAYEGDASRNWGAQSMPANIPNIPGF